MAQTNPVYAICLAGPTGSGKTALAISVARELDCEIINADSRQTYRDFPIITAQPTLAEKTAVPHHLYGYLETSQKTSAGQWAALAVKKAREISARGKIPLITGGTGFYFQTLLRGIAQIPDASADIARMVAERMMAKGSQAMHRELEKIDPQYARRIHPNDRQRIQRALEVYAGTGHTFSWWHALPLPHAPCFGPLYVLDASLRELLPRLSDRIDHMLHAGAREEVRKAFNHCGDPGAPGWSGIGCREALSLLDPAADITRLKAEWLKSTRHYAKRQITWFRGRGESIWLSPESACETIVREHGKLRPSEVKTAS